MADEHILPQMRWDSSSKSIANDRARKRVRLHSPLISSDPPLFSSDDDPSSENYTHGRCKRKYRGPWYSQKPAVDQDTMESHEEPKKPKRTFERQYDSGVWLGSDGTDMDDTIEGLEAINDAWDLPVRRLTQPKEEASPEALARKQIEVCLEDGNESIDLSYVAQYCLKLRTDLMP